MKTGKSLIELAQEIERQKTSKEDYLVSTAHTQVDVVDKQVQLTVGDKHGFGVNGLATQQISEHVNLPAKYAEKCLTELPDLYATNVNAWFKKYPAQRLIRTLDGRTRAFLSNGYRPLENSDLAETVLPILFDLKLDIMSCEVTERRLYIKAVDQRIRKDVPYGHRIGDGSHKFFDTCSPAIIISNSEVGLGMLTVDTGIFTKVCTNLATIADRGLKRRHVGARSDLSAGEEIRQLLSDETKRATDKAIWLQTADVVRGAFNEVLFDKEVDKLKGIAANEIPAGADVVKVVDFTAKKYGLQEKEKSSVLQHLIKGGDLSQYGLFNAITRTAEDLEDYDRASEFEKLGGKFIDLTRKEWDEIATAA
jgi:hypothetical protein